MEKPLKFDPYFLINTHSPEYINQVNQSFPENGLSFLDGDTVISPGSKDATKDAVGSIITAIDGVQNKDFKNAFCAVRLQVIMPKKKKLWVSVFLIMLL